MFHARVAASRPARTLLALSISFATASVHAPASLGFVDDEAQDAPSPPYVITQEVNLVALPAVVRDRQGHFASGLSVSNFQVHEDGRPQTITLFRNEDIPVTAGLVVDHSASMSARQVEVIEGARAFVQAGNSQDREFVINFGETVSFGLPQNVAFTNDVNVLRDALSTPYATGRTALYDAVLVAIHHLQKDDREKKILILISDGGDSASKHTFADVLRLAQTTGVVIYTIGLLDEHNADQNPKSFRNLPLLQAARPTFRTLSSRSSTLPRNCRRHPPPIHTRLCPSGHYATWLSQNPCQCERAGARETVRAHARRLLLSA